MNWPGQAGVKIAQIILWKEKWAGQHTLDGDTVNHINSFLQSVAHPEMFGGGDCVSLVDQPLAKVGVYAVRQNPILLHNLMAALEGREMKPFMPQKDYMLIFNMGNGRGILWKKNFVWEGRLAFLLKDYIDRKFMKKFQVAGEFNEKE